MFAGLVELYELVQSVDDLLLHGQREERVLAASSYLVMDDGLLVHNTATIMVRLEVKKAVWRIRDVYPGSRILIFTHPGSRIPDL